MAGTFDSSVNRESAAELIPEQEAASILSLVPETSAALRLFRTIRMSSKTYRQPVLASLPIAYWVDGDTGLKQTTDLSWDGIDLIAEEIAVILPIPEAVLDDAGYPIWTEARPLLAAAIGRKLDEAVFSGADKPDSWPDSVIEGAVAAGNVVEATSTPAQGGIANDLNSLMSLVEDDGYDVTGFAARNNVRGLLRGARDTSGQKLLDVTTNSIEGVTIEYVGPQAIPDPHMVVAGDFDYGLLGVRQDLTWTMLDQAVFNDDAGKIVLNLAQQDAVALRVKARYGWAIANPAEANPDVEDPFPFAVLDGAAGRSARSASKAKAATAA